MKYAIFTDSTSDLSIAECEKFGLWPEIFMQSMTCFGKDVPFDDVDDFYRRFDNGEYPAGELKTSSCGPEGLETILNHIIDQTGPDTTIVYASVMPEMSPGTARVADIVIKEYTENYPNRRFLHINTRCISNGQALFLQYLAKYTGDNILRYADDLSLHIAHLFTERDFTYTRKSGRFSMIENVGMMMMTSLKISPWMYAPSNDRLKMSSQVRRGDKILHEWVKYFIEQRTDDANVVRIGYGGAAELPRAEKLIRLLKEQAGLTDEQIQLTHTSPIVAAHTGSTVLSFFFKQKGER